MEYIALIHKEGDQYVATVPDLGYTSSYGETFAEAVHHIIEACELYAEDEEVLPIARSLEQLMESETLEPDTIPQIINIMLPTGLLRAADTRINISKEVKPKLTSGLQG
jgi:predicted RNase H-like HicB family nuclease